MDTQFEALPFEAEGEEEEEWEGERGRRPGRGMAPRRPARASFKPAGAAARAPAGLRRGPGSGRAAPGRWPSAAPGRKLPPRSYPGPRPHPHPRPGRPLWPRYYQGYRPYWPLDVIPFQPVTAVVPGPWPAAPDPEPWPDAAPDQEPWPDAAPGGWPDDGYAGPDADGSAPDEAPWPQQETPAVLQAGVNRLPAGARPPYIALGTLAQAVNDARSRGPGLYAITFNVGGQARAYSGQAGDVRRRLQQHLMCARMLGLDVGGHQAYVAPMPAAAPQQRRAAERNLHAAMFAHQPGVLTNLRRELELGLLGPAWS